MDNPQPPSFNAWNESPSPKKPVRNSRTTGMILIGGVFAMIFCLLGLLIWVTLGIIRPAQERVENGTATARAGSTLHAELLETAGSILTQAAMTPENEFTATAAQNRANAIATQTAGMERAQATIIPRTMTAQGETAQSLPMTPHPDWEYLSFHETFDSNGNIWPTGAINDEGFALDWNIERGRYRWVIDAETPRFSIMPVPFYRPVDTGQILVEIYPSDDPTAAINYGITFAWKDTGYYFAANSLGEWSLSYDNNEGRWASTQSGSGTPVSAGEPIRIGVILENSIARLYINEELVHEELDLDINPNLALIGLAIEVFEPIQTTVAFDNVSIFTPQP